MTGGPDVQLVVCNGWRRRDALLQIIAREHVERVRCAKNDDGSELIGDVDPSIGGDRRRDVLAKRAKPQATGSVDASGYASCRPGDGRVIDLLDSCD
jgi:hypothetical protein